MGVNRSGIRKELAETLTGLTDFGFQAIGVTRGQKYASVSVPLATLVCRCWAIGEENARKIAEPAAEVLAEYLPEKWLVGITQGGRPIQAVVALYFAVKQCSENEAQIVRQYHEQFLAGQPAKDEEAQDLNGNIPPDTNPDATNYHGFAPTAE